MLPSTIDRLAHYSNLLTSARNLTTGEVVTNEDVGLKGFRVKEPLKQVLKKGPMR